MVVNSKALASWGLLPGASGGSAQVIQEMIVMVAASELLEVTVTTPNPHEVTLAADEITIEVEDA
jgi:hypothetical protein